MISESQMGWVIINTGHPRTGGTFIVHHSFANKRKDCIRSFEKDSGAKWSHWKSKYNFKCVKAISTIKAFNPSS
jgi:hypothetical protein